MAIKELAGVLLCAGWSGAESECGDVSCGGTPNVSHGGGFGGRRKAYAWLAPEVLLEEVRASILAAGSELAAVLAVDPTAYSTDGPLPSLRQSGHQSRSERRCAAYRIGGTRLFHGWVGGCSAQGQPQPVQFRVPAGACSHLSLAFGAGRAAVASLKQMRAVVATSNLEDWRNLEELPCESDFSEDIASARGGDFRDFHSVFSCPVSRDESSHPVMLRCGHVISKSSMDRLPRSGGRLLFKCPTCPIEVAPNQARVLCF